MTAKTVVIVGGGQAGASCALALREMGFDGQIIVLGDEIHPPYERPELSKKLLHGECTLESVTVLDHAKAADLGIRLLTGCRVESLDRVAKIAKTDRGEFAFDWLVLATGGRARQLRDAKLTKLPSISIRRIEDTQSLREHLDAGKHVAVIGGGWLGLEAAASCRKAAMEVDVLEVSPRLCSRVVPETLSRSLEELHRQNHVRVHTGQNLSFCEGGVSLGNGNEIRPDLLIVAIGMQANDHLAAEAGLSTDGGVLVDELFRTDDHHIFSIGDCAVQRRQQGSHLRIESWQNANHSARVVACQMTGQPLPQTEPTWFWSDQFDTRFQMAGDLMNADHIVERKTDAGHIAFHFQGNKLAGIWAKDAVRDFAMARRWLSQGTEISHQRLADTNTQLKAAVLAQPC